MNEAEQRLIADRDNRNAARGQFDQRLAGVKADLAARSVTARVMDQVQQQVFTALDQGINIAKESKGIIAAVTAAVGLWLFQQPLIELVMKWFGRDDKSCGGETNQEEWQG